MARGDDGDRLPCLEFVEQFQEGLTQYRVNTANTSLDQDGYTRLGDG